MNLLILLSIPGPTIVSPAPDRSPYLEVEVQKSQALIRDLEDLILEHPEVSRKRSGSCDRESAEQVQDSSRQMFVAVENHWLGYQEGFVRIDLAGGAVLLFRS